MGRQHVDLKITASVSRHNSEQDEIDDDLWDELRDEISDLLCKARYESIRPEVY